MLCMVEVCGLCLGFGVEGIDLGFVFYGLYGRGLGLRVEGLGFRLGALYRIWGIGYRLYTQKLIDTHSHMDTETYEGHGMDIVTDTDTAVENVPNETSVFSLTSSSFSIIASFL